MKFSMAGRSALNRVRSHPWWTAAVCVPVVAASVVTGTTMASARPEPMLAVSATQLHATAAPHVLGFAAAPGKQVQVKSGAVRIHEPWNMTGCDNDYGAPDLCVPWEIPGSTPQARCAWLRSEGFGPLKVYGTNRQNLPESAQGYVCATKG